MKPEERPSLSVVIPIHDEAEAIPELLAEVVGALPAEQVAEVIFVDDGSTDESVSTIASTCEELKPPFPVKTVVLRRNFGQTAAMAAGFDRCSGEVVVTMDGDRQNDPADIPRLLAKMSEGCDIVSGWRRHRQDRYLTRRLPSQAANWLIAKLTGVDLHDFGCTLKAYRRELLADVQLYGDMHRFLPAVLSWQGVKIAELEVNHRPRTTGASHYGLSRILIVFLDVLVLKFLLSFASRPIRVYGGIGLVVMFLGLVSLAITIAMKVFDRVDMTGNPLLYLTILLALLGIQFISTGLLAELSARTYLSTHDHKPYAVARVEEHTLDPRD